jgi:hypothetical protein
MPLRRLLRALLSLLVAYAIVLGGILSPLHAPGFDPSDHLCSLGSQSAAGERIPGLPGELPQTDPRHDCCFALNGNPVILPAPIGVGTLSEYSPVLHSPFAQHRIKPVAVRLRLARAPPVT